MGKMSVMVGSRSLARAVLEETWPGTVTEGDTERAWDGHNSDEVATAKRTFDNLIAKGYSAFRVRGDGSPGERMTEFDPWAEKMVLTPPMAGG